MQMHETANGDKGTGRLLSPADTRDAAFTLRAAKAAKVLTLPRVIKYKRMYELPSPLPIDQGATPRCTGYSDVTLGIIGPLTQKAVLGTHEEANELADRLWRRAQEIDNAEYGWSLSDLEGATTRSSMKAAREAGLFGSFLWAETVEDLTDFVLHHGPAIAGTPWTDQMSRSGQDGWITIEDGPVDGDEGHQWAISGCDLRLKCPDGSKGALRMEQTWGQGWGVEGAGRAFIALTTIRKLWMAGAEFVLPIEKKLTA